jgi:hypothetical protein
VLFINIANNICTRDLYFIYIQILSISEVGGEGWSFGVNFNIIGE